MEDFRTLIVELTSGDDDRAEAAAVALAARGSESLPHLAQLSVSPEMDERWWALRAMAQIQAPGMLAYLISALDDPEPDIRQCAALALTQHPDLEALPALLNALESGDSLLAYLAGEALVAQGSPAVPALIHELENGPSAARIEAARALASIADTRAIPALCAAAGSDSALLEHWAQQGLEKMGVGMVYFKPG